MTRTDSAAASDAASLSQLAAHRRLGRFFLKICCAILVLTSAKAQPTIPATQKILVRPKLNANLLPLHHQLGGRVLKKFSAIGNLEVVQVPASIPMAELLAAYRQSGLVEYAERDQLVHALLEPNDYEFVNGDLWHLKNNGQAGGVVGADIHATAAWDTMTDASSVIVAVLDTGVRATHQDLAQNLWHNPGEIPGNGVDDDGNGWVDDVIGINTLSPNAPPDDDYGHGSHVAGIIGAAGNNNVGVAGVCWRARIMACKFLNSEGVGSISDAVTCIDYARSKGAKIINLSWGDPAFDSQALYDAIATARDAGIIVVCACGNSSANNDATPLYPASYPLDNIVAVAATTRSDVLATWSCYGATSVDLGAPGQTITSCWMGADNNYTIFSGTSMASPMVAGACALVWARFSSDSYQQIINRILTNVDPLPALAGKCVTGGRLNVAKALMGAVAVNTFAISSIRLLSSNALVLTWESEAGKNYEVLYSDSVTNGTWQPLSGTVTATGGTTSWTNSIGTESQRFFIVHRID